MRFVQVKSYSLCHCCHSISAMNALYYLLISCRTIVCFCYFTVNAVLKQGFLMSSCLCLCDESTHSNGSFTFQQNESSVNAQYGCSGIFTACTSGVYQLYHLLFYMLLARLAACSCQIQEQSQISSKLLQARMCPA